MAEIFSYDLTGGNIFLFSSTDVFTIGLPPDWVDVSEEVSSNIQRAQEITTLLRKSEKKLKKLSDGGPSEDSSIRKNVQVRLLGSIDHNPHSLKC